MKRKILFLMMAALTCIGANAALKRANNYLELPQGITATAGKTVVVDILMSNTLEIINWQAELVLPEGITLVSAEKTENWAGEVTVTNNKLFSEVDEAAAASQKLAVAKLTLNVASTVKAGEYQLSLDKIVMTASDNTDISQDAPKSVSITVEEAQQGKKGDVNGDDEVNGMDVIAIYNMILENTQKTAAADVNGDNEVNGMDVIAVYNIILGN